MKKISRTLLALALIVAPACTFAQVTITTIAGTGLAGYSGDHGPATAATFDYPVGAAFDSKGNMYVADGLNNVVRKIDTAGIITTVAGNGTPTHTGDGGPATAATLAGPWCVTVDIHNNLYIADEQNNVIRKVDTAGIITTFAGTGTMGSTGDGGPATAATFNYPNFVRFDSIGNLYVAENGGFKIRKINPAGMITTVAGNGNPTFTGEGGPATAASFAPFGFDFDGHGNLIVADAANNAIRKIDADGIITTIAGTGSPAFSGDGGPATAAAFFNCGQVISDHHGNLLIDDINNNTVRKIDNAGIITTIVGTGAASFSGDGGPATAAELDEPDGITLDAMGFLYISDWQNQRIRKVNLATAAVPATMKSVRAEVYPRPATDILHIDNLERAATYRLTDVKGTVLLQGELDRTGGTLSVKGLADGIYMLELNNGTDRTTTIAVTKQ